MLIISLKFIKKKIFAAAMIAAALVICAASYAVSVSVSGADIKCTNADEGRTCLERFGWSTDAEPLSVTQTVIPVKFSESYKTYNELQRSQGFDLSGYRGAAVTQYLYRVNGYPGGEAYAALLVLDGEVIGGDIRTEPGGGDMHAFDLSGTGISLDSHQE